MPPEDAEREVRESTRESVRAAHEAARAGREAARESGRDAEDAAREGVLAIRSGDSHIMINSGRLPRLPEGLGLKGDYIYFRHNGKPYLIQDPKIIAKTEALLAPMRELGEKQRELGRQQSMLGMQQRMLASQQRSIKIVDSPQFKRRNGRTTETPQRNRSAAAHGANRRR